MARRLAASSPRVTCGRTPSRAESVQSFLARADRSAVRSGGDAGRGADAGMEPPDVARESLATSVRLLVDYLRFFEPAFAEATRLRGRAAKRLPRLLARLARLVGARAPTRRAAVAALQACEALIPASPAIEAFIRKQRPDLLLVTPLIELGSQQVDYVKAARRLGVRSGLCVASWDNLTSKGMIRVVPDHVMVWNRSQRDEAVRLHGVAPERVVITGAQLFDHWFEGRPRRSRQEFCRTVGLDPDQPFVVYLGSSTFIAPDEVPFVERWIRRLRADADPAVAGVGVLVRPHPANSRQWRVFEPRGFDHVAVWPPIGTGPAARDFRQDYFDSLYHGAAAVGNQYERADRGWNPRAAGVHHSVAGVRPRAGGHAAFSISGERGYRTGPPGRFARRARLPAGGRAAGRGSGRGARTAVRGLVHQATWARRPRRTEVCRRHRRARSAARSPAGRRAGRRGAASSRDVRACAHGSHARRGSTALGVRDPSLDDGGGTDCRTRLSTSRGCAGRAHADEAYPSGGAARLARVVATRARTRAPDEQAGRGRGPPGRR